MEATAATTRITDGVDIEADFHALLEGVDLA
jgi:hypothetical protein